MIEMQKKGLLSIIIPFFNEEKGISELRKRLKEVIYSIPMETEILCIDDGSKDKTLSLLKDWAASDPQVKVLGFSRNFGHQYAITAGLDFCQGDAVVTIDADLQDPPEVILDLVQKYKEGFDIVFAKRIRREGESIFKKLTAYLFYRVMQSMISKELPVDVGDFRLISKPVVQVLKKMRERHRFLRGMIAWVGFKQTCVPYERKSRFSGSSNYPLSKMISLAWNGMISFSIIPLRLTMLMGTLVATLGIIYGAHAFYHAFFYNDTVRGWTSLVILISVSSGFIMICLGILGEYVGRIFEEIKGRPLYSLQFIANLDLKKEIGNGGAINE